MLIDCFRLFNEKLMLEFRLEYLNNYIDKFVIVESNKTDSGLDKPFYFELWKNEKQFSKYLDKIIYIQVNGNSPNFGVHNFTNAIYQRNKIADLEKYIELNNDDIILISDLDEIPNTKYFFELNNQLKDYNIVLFLNDLYYYNLNTKFKKENLTGLWELLTFGTRCVTFEYFKKTTSHEIRYSTDALVILNGGWHFSYFGGTESIITKIKAFGHQEFNKKEYLDRDKIEGRVSGGHDLFIRNYGFKFVEFDESMPQLLLDEKFKSWFKK